MFPGRKLSEESITELLQILMVLETVSNFGEKIGNMEWIMISARASLSQMNLFDRKEKIDGINGTTE